MKEACVKVKGRDVALGDCITINSGGFGWLGTITRLPNHYKAPFREAELTTFEGDTTEIVLNDYDDYSLFLFKTPEGEQADVGELMKRIGRAFCVRCCTKHVDDIKRKNSGNGYKYTSRDGRLMFADRSALRILPDQSRILYDKDGKEIPWPKRAIPTNW